MANAIIDQNCAKNWDTLRKNTKAKTCENALVSTL